MIKLKTLVLGTALFSSCSASQFDSRDLRPDIMETSSITLESDMPDVKRYVTMRTNKHSNLSPEGTEQIGYVINGKDWLSFDMVEGYLYCDGKKEKKPFVVHISPVNLAFFDGDRNGKVDLIKKIPYGYVMAYAPSCKKPSIIE
ncbi:MAG: hypothetical protein AABX93_01010 [Nanoarchaeota archaeon]